MADVTSDKQGDGIGFTKAEATIRNHVADWLEYLECDAFWAPRIKPQRRVSVAHPMGYNTF